MSGLPQEGITIFTKAMEKISMTNHIDEHRLLQEKSAAFLNAHFLEEYK